MRDRLPKTKPWINECGIINLYYKKHDYKEYFDSFGDLKPPIELITYLKPTIEYNYKNKQKFNTFNCGHLCLKFLFNKYNI